MEKQVIDLMGLKLNSKKKVNLGLNSFFGVGVKRGAKILKVLGLKKTLSLKDLEKESLKEIPLLMDSLGIKIRGDLRQILEERYLELIRLKLRRGSRRQKGYPVRGQRTRTNGKTAKKRK